MCAFSCTQLYITVVDTWQRTRTMDKQMKGVPISINFRQTHVAYRSARALIERITLVRCVVNDDGCAMVNRFLLPLCCCDMQILTNTEYSGHSLFLLFFFFRLLVRSVNMKLCKNLCFFLWPIHRAKFINGFILCAADFKPKLIGRINYTAKIAFLSKPGQTSSGPASRV